MLTNINVDIDIPALRRRTGFVERKIFTLIIVEDLMIIHKTAKHELTSVDLRMDNRGLRAVANPRKIDFEIVTDIRTFSRIIMMKRKNDDGFEDYNAWQAWRNDDFRVYGEGCTPKAINAIRGIFLDKEFMGKISKRYEKQLERFL